jgi:general secretion pathway protein I
MRLKMNVVLKRKSTFNSYTSPTNAEGFTLIEVLVAIAILGFSVPSVMLLMGQLTDSAGHIRDKTIAVWIAENEATELRLEHTFTQRIKRREERKEIEMAGAVWTVDVDIINAEALIKYEITVSREDTDVITLDTYLDDPGFVVGG